MKNIIYVRETTEVKNVPLDKGKTGIFPGIRDILFLNGSGIVIHETIYAGNFVSF